jgi:hypothetical protein
MRMLVIKHATDRQELISQLLRRSSKDQPVMLERLKALNPHVDLERLEAGTVLLVPDTPDLKANAGKPLSGDSFAELVDDVNTRLEATAARVRSGVEMLNADRTTVAAVIKTAAFKRLLESDRALAEQLKSADAQIKADLKQAEEAVRRIEGAQQSAAEEFASLSKLFGLK